MFLSTGCSLLRAEGFSCSLGVLYRGLGISKLQFWIKKIEIKFPAINFKYKSQRRTFHAWAPLRPRSVNFRQHFRNLSRKTVPLMNYMRSGGTLWWIFTQTWTFRRVFSSYISLILLEGSVKLRWRGGGGMGILYTFHSLGGSVILIICQYSPFLAVFRMWIRIRVLWIFMYYALLSDPVPSDTSGPPHYSIFIKDFKKVRKNAISRKILWFASYLTKYFFSTGVKMSNLLSCTLFCIV